MRGRPGGLSITRSRRGLIPASAGQTPPCLKVLPRRGAHPRECGADSLDAVNRAMGWGSSPRVRGRLSRVCRVVRCVGLIPASAGQTAVMSAKGCRRGAHPRECGADPPPARLLWRANGSSPRVRGRPIWYGYVAGAHGLIPASAGQTRGPSAPSVRKWAHPRECGADCRAVVDQPGE